ncbi:MAG: methionine aminopeptidase type [Thermoleophilia bacterium]|nr:methionine aminopeptidase type [Thermoleophilia bacterium]
MTVDTEEELEGLRAAGRVVRDAMAAMEAACEPGVTTGELDAIGRAVATAAGARSGPELTYEFPGFSCISVNDEAVHGIPGARRVEAGDLVKIDVTTELDGYFADACITVGVPPVPERAERLIRVAQRSLDLAIARVRDGKQLNRIGKAIETEVHRNGFRIMRELGGHGIGRTIHEEPRVESWYDGRDTTRMHDGMVFTIEPIIAESSELTVKGADGWTLSTADGSLSAQFEHTVVVTRGRPIILTA